MAFLQISRLATLLVLLFLYFVTSTEAQCNTNQNPYCAGVAQFEALCCPVGSICYWSNRNGDPACCAGGTDCSSDGGPQGGFVLSSVTQVTQVQQTSTVYATQVPNTAVVIATVPATTYVQPTTTYYQTSTSTYPSTWYNYYSTVTTTVPGQSTIYTTPQSFSTVTSANVVVVTETNAITGVVVATQPSANGAYVTVTQYQAIAAAPKQTECRLSLSSLVAIVGMNALILLNI